MGHVVKLSLYATSAPATEFSYAIDTSSSAFELLEKEINTKLADPAGGHVLETMRVLVTGSSLADLRAKLATIFDYCDQVRRYSEGKNPMLGRINIRFGGPSEALYWSNLYDIRASIRESILGSEWATWKTEVTFIYERDDWWEEVNTRTLLMSSGNGSGTYPLNVYNCNDGSGSSPNKHINYVDLDTADIDGDVPTPLMVKYENYTNSATGVSTIYAGAIAIPQNTSANLPTLFFEGEAATGGTGAADAACSGGNKVSVSLSTAAETALLTWALTNPQYYGSYWYKVIARFAAITSLENIKWRWKLLSGTAEVWAGPQFMVENTANLIQEMGEVPIAPDSEWSGGLSLVLTGQRTTSSTETAVLDYIQLLPSHMALKASGVSGAVVEYTKYVIMPWLYGKILREDNVRDWYAQWNQALMAQPGMYHRIYFVVQSETPGTAEVDRLGQVTVYYRRRYRVVGEA